MKLLKTFQTVLSSIQIIYAGLIFMYFLRAWIVTGNFAFYKNDPKHLNFEIQHTITFTSFLASTYSIAIWSLVALVCLHKKEWRFSKQNVAIFLTGLVLYIALFGNLTVWFLD